MDQKERIESLVAAYLANEIGPEEQVELLSWKEASPANEKRFEEFVSLWKHLDKVPIPNFEVDKADSWKHVAGQTQIHRFNKRNKYTFLRIAAGVAIVIAAFFAITNILKPETEQAILVQESSFENIKAVWMPDSSEVQLNRFAQLEYVKSFEERKVKLKGEAFFNVKKQDGERFEILANNAKIVVLGTSFNVRALPDEMYVEVTVLTGKVSVSSRLNERTIFLNKGETAIFNRSDNSLSKLEKGKSNVLSWKNQRLVFDDEPLSAVLDAMEDHFNQKIDVSNDDILNCKFTGTFLEPDFNELMKILAYAVNLDVSKEDGRVSLNGKGCQN